MNPPDDPYRIRSYVSDFDAIAAGYRQASDRARQNWRQIADMSYGAHPDERLDLFFPPLLGLTLAYWTLRATRLWTQAGLRLGGVLLAVAVLFDVAGAALDLAENGAVSAMLAAGPDGLTAALVETASRFTQLKSVCISVGASLLLVAGLGAAVVRFRRRPAR